MSPLLAVSSRRAFLNVSAATLAAWYTTPGAYADELTKTPKQTEGPFYPNKMPLDTDNDLLVINDGITPGIGEITHLTGKILGPTGTPLNNVQVEIWQCDHNGAYLHTGSGNADKRDKNFQGFGRFMTGRDGAYYFRTIKPVPYPGRTPHIHVKVKKGGKDLLVTQMYIKGHPGNAKDGVYNGVKDAKQKESITVEFKKVEDSKTGELAANFNIVLGMTPEAK